MAFVLGGGSAHTRWGMFRALAEPGYDRISFSVSMQRRRRRRTRNPGPRPRRATHHPANVRLHKLPSPLHGLDHLPTPQRTRPDWLARLSSRSNARGTLQLHRPQEMTNRTRVAAHCIADKPTATSPVTNHRESRAALPLHARRPLAHRTQPASRPKRRSNLAQAWCADGSFTRRSRRSPADKTLDA